MINFSELAFCKLVEQDQLTCLHIEHPKFFAEVCLQGAQLTQFKPAEKAPLLWLSPVAEYKEGQSVRGGVPVCWPWFGNLKKNPASVQDNMPPSEIAHGFARQLPWTVQSIKESCHNVTVVMTLTDSSATQAMFPHAFNLTLELKLSESIELTLTTHNLSQNTFKFSQALHTYLPVTNIKDCMILGAQSQSYIDALDNWKEKKQIGAINIQQEVDRLYFGRAEYSVISPSRHIHVSSNSESSVIWNPWIEKSRRLSQYPDDGYQTMVCIESANIMSDHVSLDPMAKQSLKVKITG